MFKIATMLHKILLSLAAIILSFTAIAQEVVTKVIRKGVKPVIITKTTPNTKAIYNISQFKGRWQEISRRDRKSNSAVDFTDTLFYRFTGTNDVYTRDGVNMSIRGKASVEPGNELIAAADVFDIRSVTNQEAVLDDRDKYIHTLTKVKRFWYETLPTKAITPEKFTSPISIRASDLIGNWMVYRRDADPGVAHDEYLLKAINMTRVDGNTSSGSITFFHADRTDSLKGTITVSAEKIHIATDKYSWQFNVYKATGSELVFGNSTLMYYCKPF